MFGHPGRVFLFILAGLLPAFAAPAADKVVIGTIGSTSDAGLYVAQGKGFFKDEGLDVALILFDAAAKMIAPLGTGDLDIGSGAASAGLYNAASQKVAIKIVADRGRMAPGYLYQSIMIRKDLIDSGKFKSYADLKGLKIALAAPGVSAGSVINEAAKKGGIKFTDVERVYLGFPQQVVALQNKGIDGSIMVEPFATQAVDTGAGVRFASSEEVYPNDQISEVFFGEKFATQRKDVALRFMKAYVRALRAYNDVLVDGRIAATPAGEAVAKLVADAIKLPVEQVKRVYSQAVDPDGKVNVASLKKDLEYFKEIGEVTDKAITVEQLLDMSFVAAAVTELGPYKPAR
jgi:NitT/TauT family transport system substrate-binding protein